MQDIKMIKGGKPMRQHPAYPYLKSGFMALCRREASIHRVNVLIFDQYSPGGVARQSK
jgi:hypothetical protein